MAKNKIHRLVPADLQQLAQSIQAAIDDKPGAYPVGPGAYDALCEGWEKLDATSAALRQAENDYRAAVRARDQAREDCAQAVARVANGFYLDPAVTPSMIDAAGLRPRSTSHARIVPRTPSELAAVLGPRGEVLLKWDRGTNPESVSFIVETQQGMEPWSFIGVTSRTRMTLWGYPPGEMRCFRVTASKNERRSSSSNVALIYFNP